MGQEEKRNIYIEIRNKNEKLLAQLKKNQLIISLLRLLVFIAGSILSVLSFRYSVFLGAAALLTALLFFLFLVKIFISSSNKVTFTESLIKINDNEIRAVDGDFSAFDGGADLNDPKHDFSGDIDLFGDDSLFRYLNRTVTDSGRSQLAGWLSEPYDLREEIINRQEAISELAGKLTWRQHFMASGFDKSIDEKDLISLNDWLNEDDNYFSAPFVKYMVFILPVAAIISLVLVISGILELKVFILLFVFNLLLVGIFIKKSNRIHAMVSQKHIFLSSVEQLITSFKREQFNSSVLTAVQGKMCTNKGSVDDKIRELNYIIQAFDNRLNLFVGFLLNGLLLWDFHCIMKLEKWRASASSSLPVWLNLLGTIDGLNSLANFTYNNPEYSFPVVVEGEPIIEAYSMGHPLLKKETRVSNDFSVDHKGQIFIITGANMAGKSTFLRTVAVNMVLAMIGAPVCAEKMRLSPVKLFTSMRTTDSLSQHESYFYAELKRLRVLKERLEKGKNTFFILDEILKGTNSTDKSLGSKLFLRRVIEYGGTGLIATHDIAIGEMEKEFPLNVVNKCFEIEIDGEKISFDYLLRNGITRKMNAAALMKQMGIA
jgi:hypothetical protein